MPGERWGAVGAQLPPSQVAPDDARRAAREILGRGEYQPPQPSLVERAWGWLQDQLEGLLAGLGGGAGSYWIGIAVLLAALAVAGWSLLRVLPRPGRRPRPGAAVAVDPRHRSTRRQLLARAAAAETEGRWSDAVADRYRAIVVGLADQGRLPDDLAATSGELRRALRAADDERRVFDEASTRFELVRYRGDPAGPDDRDRLAEWDRRLVGEGR